MFVTYKKRQKALNSQQKEATTIQKVPLFKLKIISGQITRANSQAKCNLDESSIASQQLNQLMENGISRLNSNNYLKTHKKNKKTLSMSLKKCQKQHKNQNLKNSKQFGNQYNSCEKKQQDRPNMIFNCQQICQQNEINDRIVLQSSAKKKIRCALPLKNSQIENDKMMFDNPQMNQILSTKQTNSKNAPLTKDLHIKRQNYLSDTKFGHKKGQNNWTYKNQMNNWQNKNQMHLNGKLSEYQTNFSLQFGKNNFNFSPQQPSFQIFDPTLNTQFNLADICRQTIKENKDNQQVQSGRTTIIDLLKDLQQSQNNCIKNKVQKKIKPKVNFYY